MALAYQKLAATAVATDPFPHVVVGQFVPPDELDAVIAALPAIAKPGSFPIGSLAFGAAARAVLDELESPRFRAAVAEKFGLDLADAATMLTLRGRAAGRDGRIHCDSTAKRVTVLLYLNRATDAWPRHQADAEGSAAADAEGSAAADAEGSAAADAEGSAAGCLRLLRGDGDIEDFAVEVPPVDGTLLVFPNGPTAWHGHKPFVGPRYVVQLNYMENGAAARSELRRHRLSALLKRLTAAL